MPTVAWQVVLLLALILGNGVFAMSEIAVVSARKARLQQRADEGDAAAAAALELASAPADFLSAVQIGISLVGIFAGAYGGATLSGPLAALLRRVPALAPQAEAIALAAVVLAITYLSLVLGELAPKQLGLNNPERIASAVARPMRLFARANTPIIRLLTGSTNLVLRLLRIGPPDEPPVTEDEIKVMIAQGTEAGVFADAEHHLLTRVFRLDDLRADDLMTPRTEIEWVNLDDAPEDILAEVAAAGFSRFPVAKGTLDDVVGVLAARELLAGCLTGQRPGIEAVTRPAPFVPESMPIPRVLDALKRTGSAMCLVIDEYGGVQGLLTVTDIMEAIVGDLGYPGEAAESHMVLRADGSWLVDGLTPIEEFRDVLDLDELPGEAQGTFNTAAGFFLSLLGRMPAVADSAEWNGWLFEVLDMDGRRVDKLLARTPAADPAQGD